MSAIACAWVASIRVGNQTAKQLLQFYASHNFGKPGFEFKNSTLAKQLEVTERSIRNAHKLLIEKEFLIKEIRYNKEGRQLTNYFAINIPNSFVDNFMGEEEARSPLGRKHVPGEEEARSPLLNNNLNNNINKRERKKRAPLSPFYPNEQSVLYCKETGLNLQEEIDSFNNRHKGEKNDYEFARWIKNSKEYKEKLKVDLFHILAKAKPNETRSTVKEYGPGHPTWEAEREWERKHGREDGSDKPRGNGVQKSTNYLSQPGIVGELPKIGSRKVNHA